MGKTGYLFYDELKEVAETGGITDLIRLFGGHPGPGVGLAPFIWETADEPDEWFYDGHQEAEYWLLDGGTPILGSLVPRSGLSERQFRQELPIAVRRSNMKAVWVLLVGGSFQFCLYTGKLEALMATCSYGR